MELTEKPLKCFFNIEAIFNGKKIDADRLKKALIEAQKAEKYYDAYAANCFDSWCELPEIHGRHVLQDGMYIPFLSRFGDWLPEYSINEDGTIIKFHCRRAVSLEELQSGNYINSLCILYDNLRKEFTDITGFYPKTIGECFFPMDEIRWDHYVNLRSKENKDLRGKTLSAPGTGTYTHILLESGLKCSREDFVGWRYLPEENNE